MFILNLNYCFICIVGNQIIFYICNLISFDSIKLDGYVITVEDL